MTLTMFAPILYDRRYWRGQSRPQHPRSGLIVLANVTKEESMDGSQFDAWTRRRFGLAAGGLSAALLGVVGLDGTEAKKKHKHKKKKKCKKLGVGCNPTGKKKRCCKNLLCEPALMIGGNRCCLTDGLPCTNLEDCCSGFCLDDECQPTSCKEIGQACATDEQCCSNNCNIVCEVPVT
jgi:hypothetical protein